MPQREGLELQSHAESYFPSPWEYFNVPIEYVEGLLHLYVQLYLNPVKPTLPGAIQQVMYPEYYSRKPAFRHLFTPEAHEAAKFFVIADFIAQKHERFHSEFKMRSMPAGVLKYVRPPFNGIVHMGYDDQKKYRDTLPDNMKKEVYLDE